jgi:hypothetical protein
MKKKANLETARQLTPMEVAWETQEAARPTTVRW